MNCSEAIELCYLSIMDLVTINIIAYLVVNMIITLCSFLCFIFYVERITNFKVFLLYMISALINIVFLSFCLHRHAVKPNAFVLIFSNTSSIICHTITFILVDCLRKKQIDYQSPTEQIQIDVK